MAHLHIGHGQHNLSVATDPDECVRRECIGCFGFSEGQIEAQHQAAACGRPGLEETAAGQAACRRFTQSGGMGRGMNHGMTPCQYDAANLMASRMRT